MRKWIAALLVCVGILCGGNAALASCVGSSGIVFNCTPGAAPTLNDLVLGGSKTGAQNGKVVSWGWSQVNALIQSYLGSAALANAGATGHVLPFLDGNNAWAGLNVFPNGDLAMRGSGTGVTTDVSANAGATNYTWTKPAGNGTPLWFNTASPPTVGLCPVVSTVAGLVTFQACGTGGGGGGTALSASDSFGNTVAPANFLTFNGFILSGTTPNGVLTPATSSRTVTGTGGTCPASGTPGATVNMLCPQDAGNIVILNGTNQTFTIGAISSTLMPNTVETTIINNNATPAAITSTPPITGYPTTGSGPYFLTLPGLQNGVAASLGLSSNGSSLQNNFGTPPGLAFTTVPDQPMSGGFAQTPLSLGTPTNGSTVTVDCGAALFQTIANNVAGFTLAMGSNKAKCTVEVTNGASAGVITPSGFTVSNSTGEYPMASIPTANGNVCDIELTHIGSLARYSVSCYQSGTGTFALVGTPVKWGAAQTLTSATVNTTGAQIIAVAVAFTNDAGGAASVSDSTGTNTWTAQTLYTNPDNVIRLFTCGLAGTACNTNAAQTFTVTGSATINFNAAVMAFSAPAGYAIDGSVVGNNAAVAPNSQPGSITPAGSGDLFITAVVNSDGTGSSTGTVNGGFTLAPGFTPYDPYLGFGMAYLIAGSAAAQNPTWNIPGGVAPSPSTMIAIKP